MYALFIRIIWGKKTNQLLHCPLEKIILFHNNDKDRFVKTNEWDDNEMNVMESIF